MSTKTSSSPWEELPQSWSRTIRYRSTTFWRRSVPAETARAISRLDQEDQSRLLTLLDPADAADLIEDISDAQAVDLIEDLAAGAGGRDRRRAATATSRPTCSAELDDEEAEAILREMSPRGGERCAAPARLPAGHAPAA